MSNLLVSGTFAETYRAEIQRAIAGILTDLAQDPCASNVNLIAMSVFFPQTGRKGFVTTAEFGEQLSLEDLAEDYAWDDKGRPGILENVMRIPVQIKHP